MIRMLRYTGFQLWLMMLVAVPASFFIQPVIIGIVPGLPPVLGVLAVCLFGAAVFGGAAHHLAAWRIDRLIREAQSRERTGLVQKAGDVYVRALRLYDTFLILPLGRNYSAQKLCEAIARFSVQSDVSDHRFSRVCETYLAAHPEDQVVALAWLKQLKKRSMPAGTSRKSYRLWHIVRQIYQRYPVVWLIFLTILAGRILLPADFMSRLRLPPELKRQRISGH